MRRRSPSPCSPRRRSRTLPGKFGQLSERLGGICPPGLTTRGFSMSWGTSMAAAGVTYGAATAPFARYQRTSARLQRTLLSIVFLYALFNGSPVSVVGGLWFAAKALASAPVFWMSVGFCMIAVVLIGIATFMARRWQLAKTQTNLKILSVK